jgi:hypothetical protein
MLRTLFLLTLTLLANATVLAADLTSRMVGLVKHRPED